MKKIVLSYITILVCCFHLFGQSNNNNDRLKALPALIDAAVKQGDYQKAADLKAEKETRQKIKEAVDLGDFQKAAELNKTLGTTAGATTTSSKDDEIRKQIKDAVAAGDYQKAADLNKLLGKSSEGSNSKVSNYSDPVPEFLNQVCFLNENDLVTLEEAKAEMKEDSWAVPFFGHSTSYYYLKGEHSPVRIARGSSQIFVVRFEESTDPKDNYKLLRFVVKEEKGKGKARYAEAYKSSGTSFKSKTEENRNLEVPISFSKVKSGLFKISPINKLESGEYAFEYGTSKLFAFTVE